ncbi:Protein CBG00995 [Caenorhabditis briggsae]|uniref:Alpha-1,3-glucosyltransferase n=1 Tax=Caenorhabditis briggsae TaxID=6238 RepID=A8WP54_CAEBR|nr:Protein CBG00995 [Caenorhabditis briggsae]CAP22260.2 Protein CBG00995 [Caenorhabditis briggsae]
MGEIPCILSIGAILIAFKCLLIPSYTSTDFEVHRNWMAVTWNRPLKAWYTESTSEWTLDYPPFFAYFEWALAYVAHTIGFDDCLQISMTPIMSPRILVFQRLSVIATDIFYVSSRIFWNIAICALYAFKSPRLVAGIPKKMRKNAQEACFILLATLQALLICDSVHFQYNSMLTAFFILSMYFIDFGMFLLIFFQAALTFSVLLNFKHIYVYYALGYVFFYLVNYFEFSVAKFLRNFSKGTTRYSFQSLTEFLSAISLAIFLLLPFAFSIFPFFHVAGAEGLQNIATRLFPVSRGLTHAFWAPNFWALYNFADLILYRVLSNLNIGKFEAPTYTSGLVQEYSHSVLPSVNPIGTLFLVVIASVIVLTGLVIRWRKDSRPVDFSLFAVFSALSFFYFGYHVHEKAIILITVPMTIFAIKDPKYHSHLIHLSCVASFSLFPLLFTPFEVLLKYAICVAYFFIQLTFLKRYTRMPLGDLLPWRHVASWAGLAIVEIYNTFLHKWLLSDRLPFAPLMVISVLTSIELTSFFGSLIWTTFADGIIEISWQKATCRLREQLIRDMTYSVQTVEDEQDVQIVAGVDTSASSSNPDMVYVSVSFWKYPGLQHLATISDTRILRLPYIPQYLAVREAEVVADFVRTVIAERPELRPDVILCDGFGRFHSRSCGMACHVGALTGIPSIGIAKNLALHDVYETVGIDKKSKVDQFVDSCREVRKPKNECIYKSNKPVPGFIPFDIVEPVKLNILRMGGSMVTIQALSKLLLFFEFQSGVFVSAGYGIDLDLATTISSKFLLNNTTCEPIRAADLESRRLVRENFDGNRDKIE